MTGQALSMSGKKASFTEAESDLLRESLRRYRAEHELSQTEMGALLGIKQQNVARFESRKGGIGRSTANALAQLLSYRDVEALLLDAGVLAEMQALPAARSSTGAAWSARDMAVRWARRMKIAEEAIAPVIARYTDDSSRHRPEKWWIGKFLDEEKDRRDAPVPVVPPPPASEVPTRPTATHSTKKRRTG